MTASCYRQNALTTGADRILNLYLHLISQRNWTKLINYSTTNVLEEWILWPLTALVIHVFIYVYIYYTFLHWRVTDMLSIWNIEHKYCKLARLSAVSSCWSPIIHVGKSITVMLSHATSTAIWEVLPYQTQFRRSVPQIISQRKLSAAAASTLQL